VTAAQGYYLIVTVSVLLIHPDFTGTIPNFDNLSQDKYKQGSHFLENQEM